ncbi:hypothetical protein [Nitratireductor pacificus]|uniref:Uncharacterized protein n=1 Tax=Nitratireductor pacificus pht-3B TaxID=391937 RepID=K2MXX5_9HYPH|nr:hypothetical protein NA2_20993 [Nitratireductor pacificus pht-3B]
MALRPLLGVSVLVGVFPVISLAHEAKSGWRYPYACCSDNDCREIKDAAISEVPDGYLIKVTGEVVSYSDKRVKNSPDGVFHWCSVAGKDDSRTICLFVPPRSY